MMTCDRMDLGWITPLTSPSPSISYTDMIHSSFKTSNQYLSSIQPERQKCAFNNMLACVDNVRGHRKWKAPKSSLNTPKHTKINAVPKQQSHGLDEDFIWHSVKLEWCGITCAACCQPIVPFQQWKTGQFPVILVDCRLTSGCLSININCRVTSLCKVLSKFLNSAVQHGIFLKIKKNIANISFSFQFSSLNFSLI